MCSVSVKVYSHLVKKGLPQISMRYRQLHASPTLVKVCVSVDTRHPFPLPHALMWICAPNMIPTATLARLPATTSLDCLGFQMITLVSIHTIGLPVTSLGYRWGSMITICRIVLFKAQHLYHLMTAHPAIGTIRLPQGLKTPLGLRRTCLLISPFKTKISCRVCLLTPHQSTRSSRHTE